MHSIGRSAAELRCDPQRQHPTEQDRPELGGMKTLRVIVQRIDPMTNGNVRFPANRKTG